MREYFTADLHLGHEAVARLRGFDSSATHDGLILDGITETLRTCDRLHVVGDVSKDEKTWPGALGSLRHLNAELGIELHLYPGNHDPVAPHRSKAFRHFREAMEVFDSTQHVATVKVTGRRSSVYHYSYNGDHSGADRYPEYRPRDLSTAIIHGHTHASEPASLSSSRSGIRSRL